MAKNIKGLKRGWSYREATGGRGGLGLYSDGLLFNEYENYGGNDEQVIICGKNLTGTDQWFTEASSTKNYDIGTKMVVEDMIFRYAHTGPYTDSCWRGRGMLNLGKNMANSANTDGSWGHVLAASGTAAVAGATTIILTLDGSYAATANEFAGGFLYMESSPWTGAVTGRIRSNTATATTTTFTLKEGIVAATGASPNAKVHWNQYGWVGKPYSDHHAAHFCSVVGCLWVNVAANTEKYVWLQTWGPYLGQYAEAEQPGEGKTHRAVYFDSYGGFTNPATTLTYGEGINAQLAGFSIPCTYTATADGNADWSPWVMLQISP